MEKRLDWYLIGCALFFISKLPKPYVLYTLVSRNSRQQKLDKKTSFDEVPHVQLLHIQSRRNPRGGAITPPHILEEMSTLHSGQKCLPWVACL